MNKKFNVIVIILVFIFGRCGSNTPTFTALKKPASISRSTEITTFKNNETRLAYVADQFTQSITVVDTDRQELVDTAHDDDFDFSPIPVGGEPIAVAVDDSVTPHRVFVADQLNNQILAFQYEDIDQDSDQIIYKPVSLGGTLIGVSSRAIFKNAGASSSPTVTNIEVNVDKAKNESWFLNFKDDSYYEVTGTVSGEQVNRAVEGEMYTSDGGEISFFISAGGEKTTNDDKFFFGTALVKPQALDSTPVDMLIKEDKLYILTKNVPSVVVYDLDLLDIESETTFDPDSVPSKMAIDGNDIYISNLASPTFFIFHIDSETISEEPTTLTTGTRAIGAQDEHVFLVQDSSHKMVIWNLDTHSAEKTLSFDNPGNAFLIATPEGENFGLIPNFAGDVDVVDLDTLKKFDTDLGDKNVFIDPEFFDVEPESNPELITVNTTSSTLTESWQMTFEGVIEGNLGLEGDFSSNTVTAPDADFISTGVKEGDLVVVPSQDKEFEIESVDSATTLTLTSDPSFSGEKTFDIRANGEYILVGSISGVQENRIKPGFTYDSDTGQISLKTSPSFDKPETRGDFFSFGTVDLIDPILTGSQAVATDGIFFERMSDDKPVAYILEQTTGQIVIVDLTDFNIERTL